MPDASTFRIMIVEDQGAIRQLIHSCLLQMRCRNIVECGDGEEALKRLSERPPQLIISDLNMPKVDGLELLRKIRSMPEYEKTPFILLTSRAEVKIVQEAKELKVNNYMIKPFTLATLKSKIEAVVGPLT